MEYFVVISEIENHKGRYFDVKAVFTNFDQAVEYILDNYVVAKYYNHETQREKIKKNKKFVIQNGHLSTIYAITSVPMNIL